MHVKPTISELKTMEFSQITYARIFTRYSLALVNTIFLLSANVQRHTLKLTETHGHVLYTRALVREHAEQ